jgi:hypothetical protein
MSRQQSYENVVQALQNVARLTLGEAECTARQALLQQTAEELWQVSQAPVSLEDEPAWWL